MSSRFALIGVPSSAGARRTGQERAPAALRAAGLLEKLRAAGLDIEDHGDLPTVTFHPDPEHPRQQNLALVVDTWPGRCLIGSTGPGQAAERRWCWEATAA